ncbi:phospholipid N-methyltransferase [Halopolyspora algeriensis]|uniref:Phospholipid N-methyltransferase n=1 Tax=Halopolyspora algeriensis TaxID=1500506 RepID=A0A368VZE7_9ACTN|nr:methyltransferase domain-containing protein [Halopolyspora algeriensis]RCW46752.1 phospholipid N-methyltransferase [Halopolyspora algeriensis]
MTTFRNRRTSLSGRWLPVAAKLGEYRTFFGAAVRNPTAVGAATPTSEAVAATVAQVVPTTGSPVVVELGPGTGSLSGAIHNRLPPHARHIGIEIGADLVRHLQQHQPWMETLHGDAGNLRALLATLHLDKVDAVVSSIPWSLLTEETRQDVLRQVTDVLAPHGAFTALTYLPARHSEGGRHFQRQLATTFDEVITHTTWRNFPPILHYICRRPLEE